MHESLLSYKQHPSRFDPFPPPHIDKGLSSPRASQGDKWHYAPLARRLSEQGVVTCVMEYTLFPAAQAAAMVHEVDAALEWVFENIRSHGGDPARVAVMGHSAGKSRW